VIGGGCCTLDFYTRSIIYFIILFSMKNLLLLQGTYIICNFVLNYTN